VYPELPLVRHQVLQLLQRIRQRETQTSRWSCVKEISADSSCLYEVGDLGLGLGNLAADLGIQPHLDT